MSKGQAPTTSSGWVGIIRKQFPREQRFLIPVLQFVQGKAGYLPSEAMSAAAKHLGVSESKVYGVASFYAQFYFEPRGLHSVTICRGTACHVRGSARLLTEVEKQLGVKAGGTTSDMEFSLETVACYGSCALAPVVVADGKVHRQQTTVSLGKLVKSLGSGSRKR